MNTLTLEQRLKRALPIGLSLVRFTRNGRHVDALVRIGNRGRVSYLKRPGDDDMYSTWQRVKGDLSINDGPVHVWAGRSPEFMAPFHAEPSATLEV